MTYWGHHLLLDCSDCDLTSITDKHNIYNFVKTVIQRIDMVAYGEPQIELLLPGTSNQGFSVLQMITTSNITAHFVDEDRSAYIDVFSCKNFDSDVVIDTIKEFFKPRQIKSNLINRHA